MAQTKFKTIFNRSPKDDINSPTGDFTEFRHRPEMKKDGRRELIKDKEVAIYDLIQASREDCEIENIIRRAVEGDYNALNQGKGVYADITGAPESIAQAQQWIIDIKQKFDELPADIKAKFENNVEIYTAQFGSKEWADKVGYTEALEKEELARKSAIEFDNNMRKAVSNIANGTAYTQNNIEGGVTNE